ncbi:MAG: hypothetical protein PV362_16790 [Providencia heimbachae]|nr:hypothetical protein [Providencia heimbachae]
MSDIDSLSKKLNTSTVRFVLLTFVTAGIYPVIWLYKASKLIEVETKHILIHPYYYVLVSFLLGWSLFLGDAQLVMTVGGSFYGLSMFLSKMVLIALIVWAFKAKSVLQIFYLKN